MTHKTFKREDLKAGMVCEVEENGSRSLVMIMHDQYGELIMSGENIWGDLCKVNNETLTYGFLDPTAHKFIKVWGIPRSYRLAHKVSTEGRELLWERKEKKSLTLEEVSKLLGYPVEIVPTTPSTDEPTDKPTVDVEKMRDELAEWCDFRWCTLDNCPLAGETCRCGRGTNFKKKTSDGTYDMTDDEIIAAYKLVFPDKAVEDKPHEYKVGDKVVIKTDEWHPKGVIATIVAIDCGDDLPYKCRYNCTTYWYSGDDIEPYKEV